MKVKEIRVQTGGKPPPCGGKHYIKVVVKGKFLGTRLNLAPEQEVLD